MADAISEAKGYANEMDKFIKEKRKGGQKLTEEALLEAQSFQEKWSNAIDRWWEAYYKLYED